jgi:fructose-1,6-bisphosphatase/inositol monophosphatase family enzyme
MTGSLGSESTARRFVDVLCAAAWQAGAVAQHLQGHVPNVGKQGSGTPESDALSLADLATQDVLLLRLAESFAGIAVDAEEDTPVVQRFARATPHGALIVLDPIDGSLNYLDGSPDYAVMGSLIEHDRYVASVVHFPAHDATYWAIRGGGCHRRRLGIGDTPVKFGSLPTTVLVPPRLDDAARLRLQAQGLTVEPSRCSAVDASAPVMERALGSVHPGRADRRRAIGFLLVTEAGGCVRFADGFWEGEDPEASRPRGAHAVAYDEAHASALLDVMLG